MPGGHITAYLIERARKRDDPLSHSSAAATLACHGEDADHKVDAPVAQKRHLSLVPVALFGFLLGLDGGPDADPEDQQVEEDHNSHAGDVESHDGAAVVRMRSAASSLDGAACVCAPGGSGAGAQRRRLELQPSTATQPPEEVGGGGWKPTRTSQKITLRIYLKNST